MVGSKILGCCEKDSPFGIELADDEDEDDEGSRFACAGGP